jgi:hypothetical protein
MDKAALDFYATPAPLSAAGRYTDQLSNLPRDVSSIARAIQGLLIHEYWTKHYAVEPSDARREDAHIRPIEQLLEAVITYDQRPLVQARAPEQRAVVVCRSFALLLTAALRAQHVPARARCGFARYFDPARYIDHWVCEYWHAGEARWVRVDPQLDEQHQRALSLDFSPLDVPHDRFVVAGDAWRGQRAGKLDSSLCGIEKFWGAWFIAANLVHDLAALNKQELLAWDIWGAVSRTRKELTESEIAWCDEIAAISSAPDRSLAEICALLRSDARLRVPEQVFNVRRQREEHVAV